MGKGIVLAVVGVALLSLPGSKAFAWGERGHQIVSSMAARAVADSAPANAEGQALAKFYADRSLILGHVANIPDTSWKDAKKKRRINKMNSPNHYFGPERLLGPPGADFGAFLRKVRLIPTDYAELKAQYDGKKNALPGVPAEKQTLKLYEDLGVTPYRGQQLFDVLVAALQCAKSKETMATQAPGGAYPAVESPFRQPKDGGLGHTSEPPLPTYVCNPQLDRRSDLHAAVVASGALAHFVGDQGQPYHPTADHDGWVTGNGGIHVYFESLVVQALDERLASDSLDLARDPSFRQQTWLRIGTDLGAPGGMARMLIYMAADAQSHMQELREVDDRVAMTVENDPQGNPVIQKSDKLPWGDHPSYHPAGTVKNAKRYSADKPEVLAAFRPIVLERLATSIVALSRAWETAWELAGKPKLSDQHAVSLPYPLDPEFIWPDFDLDALKRSAENPIIEHSMCNH